MKTKLLLTLLIAFAFRNSFTQTYEWELLPNSPVPDSTSQRFEDIHFVNPNTGWVIQYTGRVYKTTDAGNSWVSTHIAPNFPFAKFRSLGFFDSQKGLLGTLNSANPLYRTTNGGINWFAPTIPAPVPYGICGISIVNSNVAYACGRYAAPANVIKTTDAGSTWTSFTMNPALVSSLVDCYFWSQDSGIVVGGYSATNYTVGKAVVLLTTNGGTSWQRVHITNRTGEWCWKIAYASSSIGYISIERHSGMSYILKTTNGGFNWQEKVFADYDQEGIGFVDENTGWIGGWTGPTYKTTNGGDSWNQVNWGYYVNRFRFLNDTLAYAVGDRVYRYIHSTIPTYTTKFAIIGDYGKAGVNEQLVANYVKSWNPHYILTLGNNNYESGEQATIDDNIGQFYHGYIYPYSGNYPPGDTVNSFFPSLGVRDWNTTGAAPYLNYFQLPGNERYYDFIKGNVHFFCINSDASEPDGIDSNSVQAQWLKTALAESPEKWNVVYFHHPPYTSGTTHGPEAIMQWPFQQWGATTVLSGREHIYERLNLNGFTYFVNGLGGESIYPIGAPATGSIVRYNGNYGTMLGFAYQDSLVFKFYNITGQIIDSYKLFPVNKNLTLKVAIEGYYGQPVGPFHSYSVKTKIRESFPPYNIVDSTQGSLSASGTANFTLSRVNNATNYYIVFQHKNTIETWSTGNQKFTLNNLTYDFRTSASQAYGSNQVLLDTTYCIYSGDVNQDGIIDASDLGIVDNAAFIFSKGGDGEDLNGDFIVDADDLAIVDNNSANFVGMIRP